MRSGIATLQSELEALAPAGRRCDRVNNRL